MFFELALMPSAGSRRFLVLVGCYLVATALFLGLSEQVLFPADFLSWFYPFRGHAPFDQHPGSLPNTYYQDVAFYYFPYWAFAGKMAAQGVIPFWSPLEGLGLPADAAHSLGFYFPLHWLTYPFWTPVVAWHLELAIEFLVCSWASFAFFRRVSGSVQGATLAALAWTLAAGLGPFFQQLGPAWPMALLPVTLLGLEMVEERRATGVWLVVAGVWFTLVAGHLQYTLPALLLCFGYALLRGPRRGFKVAAMAVGVVPALPHLVALLQLLALSHREALSSEAVLLNLLAPREYLNFLFPFLMGSPAEGFYLGRSLTVPVINGREHCLYLGQSVLILALLALGRAASKGHRLLGAALLAGYLLAGWPWAYKLLATLCPPLWHLTPLRFLPFLHFGCCYLAALGWAGVQREPLRSQEVKVLLGVVGLWVAGVLFYVIPANADPVGFASWVLLVVQQSGGVSKPPYYEGSYGEHFVNLVQEHFALTSFAVGLPLIMLVLLALALRLKKHRFPVVLALLIVDLSIYFFTFNRPVDKRLFYPELPEIASLKTGHQLGQETTMPTRVLALERGVHPNILLVYGIATVEAYASVLPHNFRQIFDYLNQDSPLPHQLAALQSPARLTGGLLDLLGVTTLYNHPPAVERDSEKAQLHIAAPRTSALRAYLCSRWAVSKDSKDVYSPDFDPRTEVLLDSPPSFESQLEAGFQTLTPTDYGCNSIGFEIQTSQPALLVVTDLHYPGWTVEVNGQSRSLLQAYGFARAVELQPGANKVRFDYRPRGRVWMLPTILFALLASVGLSFINRPSAQDGS